MKRSFQSLSPQEALHVAVFIEERNAQLYHQFAEMFVSFQDFPSLEIAGVLWDMAVEERHHSSLLQQRYTEKYGQAACCMTETDILEVIEQPQLESAQIFDINAEAASAQRRALELALTAENMARAFYTELAQTAEDPDLLSLYTELAAFEKDHVEFLERRLAGQIPSKSGNE
jgi:rubrerythrin